MAEVRAAPLGDHYFLDTATSTLYWRVISGYVKNTNEVGADGATFGWVDYEKQLKSFSRAGLTVVDTCVGSMCQMHIVLDCPTDASGHFCAKKAARFKVPAMGCPVGEVMVAIDMCGKQCELDGTCGGGDSGGDVGPTTPSPGNSGSGSAPAPAPVLAPAPAKTGSGGSGGSGGSSGGATSGSTSPAPAGGTGGGGGGGGTPGSNNQDGGGAATSGGGASPGSPVSPSVGSPTSVLGVAIGIAVGAVVLTAILVVASVLLILRRRKGAAKGEGGAGGGDGGKDVEMGAFRRQSNPLTMDMSTGSVAGK